MINQELLLVLTGVILLMAGIGVFACFGLLYYYYYSGNKENAGLYFFLGTLSMLPEVIYLFLLLRIFVSLAPN